MSDRKTLRITEQRVKRARLSKDADFPANVLNEYLYKLCRSNPDHDDHDVILAKLMIIGRTYAAALERARNPDGKSLMKRYDQAISQMMRGERALDTELMELVGLRLPTTLPISVQNKKTIQIIIRVHKVLTEIFEDAVGQRQTSLASKYLHFHYQRLYFIYDSRALTAVRKYRALTRIDAGFFESDDTDYDYASYFLQCLSLRSYIWDKHKVLLPPRQIDNLLCIWGEN